MPGHPSPAGGRSRVAVMVGGIENHCPSGNDRDRPFAESARISADPGRSVATPATSAGGPAPTHPPPSGCRSLAGEPPLDRTSVTPVTQAWVKGLGCRARRNRWPHDPLLADLSGMVAGSDVPRSRRDSNPPVNNHAGLGQAYPPAGFTTDTSTTASRSGIEPSMSAEMRPIRSSPSTVWSITWARRAAGGPPC